MNASATSDFSPPDSSDRRLVDLPGGVTSISTPASGCSSSSRPGGSAPSGGVLAGDHGARALALHEPQPAAAAREQVLHDLLEVLRGGLEGLLEALADAPVGLGDQALELRHRRLEVAALLLELLDVRDRLLVLLLGKRVDGPELLAAAVEPVQARGRAPRAPRRAAARERARRGGPGRSRARQLALDLGGAVAHLLGRDLGAGDRLAGVAQPALQPGLLVGARAQRLGGLLAAGGVALELLGERVASRRDGARARCRAPRRRARRAGERASRSMPARTRSRARVRSARSASMRSARRRSARRSASSSARRTAPGPRRAPRGGGR